MVWKSSTNGVSFWLWSQTRLAFWGVRLRYGDAWTENRDSTNKLALWVFRMIEGPCRQPRAWEDIVQGGDCRRAAHISFLPGKKTWFSLLLCWGIHPFLSLASALHAFSPSVCVHQQVDAALVSLSPQTAVSQGHYDSCSLLSTSFLCSLVCLSPLLSTPLCTTFLGCVSTYKGVHACAHPPPLVVTAPRIIIRQCAWWRAVLGKLIVPTHPKDTSATSSPVTHSRVRNVHDSGQTSRPGACGTSCPAAVSNKPTGAAFLCLEDRPSLVRQVNISHSLQKIRQPVCQVPGSLAPCAPSSPAFQLSFVSWVTAQTRVLCCPLATLWQELKSLN